MLRRFGGLGSHRRSVEEFRISRVYKDLKAALTAEFVLRHANCVHPEEFSESDGERYRIYGYPKPITKPRCWCPKFHPRRCANGHKNCPFRPAPLTAGRDYEIVKCWKDHSRRTREGCDGEKCWVVREQIPTWLSATCEHFEDLSGPCSEPFMQLLMQQPILDALIDYGYNPEVTAKYSAIVCMIIEELHHPYGPRNLEWQPTIHGILAFHERHIWETAQLGVNGLRNYRAYREERAEREGASDMTTFKSYV